MSEKKNYIKGSCRMRNFQNGGSAINLSINVNELAKIADDKGYARIVLSQLRQADQYGNTHSIYQDEFVPTKKEVNTTTAPSKPLSKKAVGDDVDDLPF